MLPCESLTMPPEPPVPIRLCEPVTALAPLPPMSLAAPCSELPATIVPVSFAVPCPPYTPPPLPAEFPLIVQSVSVAVSPLYTPPPPCCG